MDIYINSKVEFLVVAACASFFAYRAWGLYPCLFFMCLVIMGLCLINDASDK